MKEPFGGGEKQQHNSRVEVFHAADYSGSKRAGASLRAGAFHPQTDLAKYPGSGAVIYGWILVTGKVQARKSCFLPVIGLGGHLFAS